MNATATGSPYLMESEAEGRRLETKTVADTTLRQLELVGLRPGMRCIDVGCGTGAVSRLMASIAGPQLVLGLDASGRRIEEARSYAASRRIEVDFVEGDAERIDAPDGGFDFCWSRFLYEYLPRPRAVLREMVRVTRPGGIVAVGDLDAQLEHFHGLVPQAEGYLREILSELDRSGFDRRVGRRLYGWFLESGLHDIEVHVMPHQVFAGGLPEREQVNWSQKLEVMVPRMIERGGDAATWRAAHELLLEQLRDPRLFYYSTLVLVRGIVPDR